MNPSPSLWKRARAEAVLPYVVTGVALITGVVFLGEEIGHHIRNVQGWVGGLGPWAFAVFALLYALLSSVFVPDTLVGIIVGSTFGFSRGLMVAMCGSVVGAILQYALSRRLFKPAIDRLLIAKPTLAATQAAVLTQELRLQLLIRLTPLNRALTSYVLGAAGVRFGRFVLALAALLPHLCLEVYFGYAGSHLAKVASRPRHTVVLHDIVLVVGLVVAVAVMVLVSRAARRAVEAATVSAQGASQPPALATNSAPDHT